MFFFFLPAEFCFEKNRWVPSKFFRLSANCINACQLAWDRSIHNPKQARKENPRILDHDVTQNFSCLIAHKTIYKSYYLLNSTKYASMTPLCPYWPKQTEKNNLINKPTANFKTHDGFGIFLVFSNIIHSKMKCCVDVKQCKKSNTPHKMSEKSKKGFGIRFCGIKNPERAGSCGAGPNLCRT